MIFKFNRVPIAYIQRILIKSVFHIPNSYRNKINDDAENVNEKLYLVDAFRAPLARLFELNEFLRNFHTDKLSLVDDLCIHVGEVKEKRYDRPESSSPDDSKQFLPEFNCLYLSPSNFWSNNLNNFMTDDDIMQTINDSPDKFKSFKLKRGDNQETNFFDSIFDMVKLFNLLNSRN